MSSLLNAGLVRARRLELGLSERELSAVAGLGQAVIRGLEAGINHHDLTLGEIHRLAAALTVDVTQLLAGGQPKRDADVGADTEAEAEAEADGNTDVGRVGSLLFGVDRLVAVESLAETTGLTLQRTHTVLTELDARLRTIGLRVHHLGNDVRVSADVDAADAATLQRLWRAHLARRGLDIGQVHALHQVRTGRRAKALTNDQRVTVSQLTNAGLLTRTASGGAELSPDVRYSLLLDEPTTDQTKAR